MILLASGETDRGQTFCRTPVAFGAANAGIEHRQFNILERRRARQKIESLKHESDFVRANVGTFVFGHFGDILTIKDVSPFRRAIETTKDVHRCRFS
jgi:hypothetical protein